MLKIVKGNFEDLKREMKQFRGVKANAIKNLKKLIKGISNDDPQKVQLTMKYQKDIEKLEFYTLKVHNSSKVLPVRVGDVIINYKAYQSFIKKINGFQVKGSLIDNVLRIDYKAGQHSKGRLELVDISEYYTDFKNIPVAEPEDEEA